MRRAHRAMLRAGIAIFVACAFVPVDRGAEPPQALCGEGPDDKVKLVWPLIPTPDAIATVSGTSIPLVVENLAGRRLAAEIRAVADDGAARFDGRVVSRMTLGVRESRTLSIDLAELGFDLAGMRFSGQLVVTALTEAFDREEPVSTAPGDDGEPEPYSSERVEGHDPERGDTTEGPVNRDVVFSNHLFFHGASGGAALVVYGEEALRDAFHSGDLTDSLGLDRVRSDLPVPTTIQRVTEGGSGFSVAPIFPDDGITRDLHDDEAPTGGDEASGGGRGGLGSDESLAPPTYHVCVSWEFSTSDSGKKVKLPNGSTITEDYWADDGFSGGGGFLNPGISPWSMAIARGVRAMIYKNGVRFFGYADPDTGCFTFQTLESPPFLLAAYTDSRDADGNRVRVLRPDDNLYATFKVINPPASTVVRYPVGSGTPQATLAAVSAFATWRAHFGLSGKEMRLKECSNCGSPGSNCSSAHFGSLVTPYEFEDGKATVSIFSGGAQPSGDGMGNCSNLDHRRYKFIISHELGHAWLLLAIQENDIEPNVDDSLSDADDILCTPPGAGYTLTSLEWNSIGAREGAAHFYATEVWNNHSSNNAVFTWFGVPFDAESEPPHREGGRLWNTCTVGVKCARTTNIDWAKFWWDWHTPYQSGRPTTFDVRRVYAKGIQNGDLEKGNYYLRFREAVDDVLPSNKSRRVRFDDFARWNGIDSNSVDLDDDHFVTAGSTTGLSCIAPFGYPECDCWTDRSKKIPKDCLGILGCPCLDVDLFEFDPSADNAEQDGLYPDGPGSYLDAAPDSAGQYCEEGNQGLPPRGAVCGIGGHSSKPAPVCKECGIDTMFGCPCETDGECAGFDAGEVLTCWASPLDGWAGNRPGICLPDPSTEQRRDQLEELSWFCLDNCRSKGSSYRCLYNQLQDTPPIGLVLDHAQCVDSLCDTPVGFCEERGMHCDPQKECPGDDEDAWMECCVDECQSQDDCDALGFPAHYVCDFGTDIGPAHGHCVPAQCGNLNFYLNNVSYCQMFWGDF